MSAHNWQDFEDVPMSVWDFVRAVFIEVGVIARTVGNILWCLSAAAVVVIILLLFNNVIKV